MHRKADGIEFEDISVCVISKACVKHGLRQTLHLYYYIHWSFEGEIDKGESID